jgi:diguanylate cyclase
MNPASTDWKYKYLQALDDHEVSQRQLKKIAALQNRGLIRLSMIAEGIDSELDKQLIGLRGVLRETTVITSDLSMVVDALESQLKRMDLVKTERGALLLKAFQAMIDQLRQLDPERDDGKRLKKFSRQIKDRSQRMQEYAALVHEFSQLQQAILSAAAGRQPGRGWWSGWLGRGGQAPASVTDEADTPGQESQHDALLAAGKPVVGTSVADTPAGGTAAIDDTELAMPDVVASADSVNDAAQPAYSNQPDAAIAPHPIVDRSAEAEPPFSRLSDSIRSILLNLLEQIEPPRQVRDTYTTARRQVEERLNWYELVPTLENISLVVLAALDRNQQEYEQFLLQLNQRLDEAYGFIDQSGQLQNEGFDAGRELARSMREEVGSIQQDVVEAQDLGQLKSKVNRRLDTILATVDRYQANEQRREKHLNEQLNALVERVKVMEVQSAEAEKRLEEQRQLALRDELTQLPNRQGYQQRLAQEFERWQRYQRPLSLVVCDVDNFKVINDSYGHLAGDKVLRVIAKTLAKRLRKTDYIARFGGEEFVILMPETGLEEACEVAETVREAIAVCPFHFKDQPVPITLSFGISEFVPGDQPDQVFERADQALYQAKANGRNRIELAELAADD